MKKLLSLLVASLLVAAALLKPAPVRADDKSKDEQRLQDSGEVMKEIIDIPDDIPQNLLDKADCVIVMPSVLKAAFVVGGSYGRGAMTCRSGDNFQGPWGAPTMMALEGVSVGFQLGGQATDFVLLVMNPRGAQFAILSSKVKLGGDASAAAGPVGRERGSSHGRDPARRSSHLFAIARIVCGHFAGRLDAASGQRRQRAYLRLEARRQGLLLCTGECPFQHLRSS